MGGDGLRAAPSVAAHTPLPKLTELRRVCISIHMERNSRRIVARLRKEGWTFVSASGSHHKFRKGSSTIIVPHPRKDIANGTAREIARMAGWLEKDR